MVNKIVLSERDINNDKIQGQEELDSLEILKIRYLETKKEEKEKRKKKKDKEYTE